MCSSVSVSQMCRTLTRVHASYKCAYILTVYTIYETLFFFCLYFILSDCFLIDFCSCFLKWEKSPLLLEAARLRRETCYRLKDFFILNISSRVQTIEYAKIRVDFSRQSLPNYYYSCCCYYYYLNGKNAILIEVHN